MESASSSVDTWVCIVGVRFIDIPDSSASYSISQLVWVPAPLQEGGRGWHSDYSAAQTQARPHSHWCIPANSYIPYIAYAYHSHVVTWLLCINRKLCCLEKSEETYHQQIAPKLKKGRFSADSTQYICLDRHKKPYNAVIWTCKWGT